MHVRIILVIPVIIIIVIIIYYYVIKFRFQFFEFTLYGVNSEMCINRENIVTREESLGRNKVSFSRRN